VGFSVVVPSAPLPSPTTILPFIQAEEEEKQRITKALPAPPAEDED
jgi:hypothetical protein